MTPDEREHIAMSASMDRISASLRDSGPTIEVSTAELVSLCNMAYLGMLYLARSDDAIASGLLKQEEIIGRYFATPEHPGGVNNLFTVCTAMFGSEKFGQLIARDEA